MNLAATDIAAAASVIAAAAAAAGGYWIARRQRSGVVATSEAETLWEEARKQRDWLAAQLDLLRDEHTECRSTLADHERTIRSLKSRVSELERRLGTEA